MEVRLIILLNEKHRKEEDYRHSERDFTTELQRVPNIDESFEYTYDGKTNYYGEVIRIETYKDDLKCVEHLYVTIKEFE